MAIDVQRDDVRVVGALDSPVNADVTWEGPDYAKLRPILFGYATFQALYAAVELDLFTTLSARPGLTAAEIAEAIALSPYSTRLLLLTCASIELVVKNGDKYYNSAVSDKLLVRGKPKCALPFIRSGQFLQYKGFYHLLEALRLETSAGLEEYPDGHLYDDLTPNPELEPVLYETMAAIWELSHTGLDGIAEYAETKHLLDVAGGNGVVASLLHDKYPHLRISILDRPTACERAMRTVAANSKSKSIDSIPGDMFTEPFPTGPDGINFCHILEALSAQDRTMLLEKAHASLPSGGRVFAYGFACRNDERGELYGARISLYFLVTATGAGMAYPPKDYAAWIADAGFVDVKVYGDLPFEHVLVVGTKA